ncbi:hypothetical protein ACB092_02G145500 [Castanea dentata]
MLLSVHGSPLGVYKEDNMEARHESEEGQLGSILAINMVQEYESPCNFKSIRMYLCHCTNDYFKYQNCSCILMQNFCNDIQVKNVRVFLIHVGPCNSSSFALIITKEQCYYNPLVI